MEAKLDLADQWMATAIDAQWRLKELTDAAQAVRDADALIDSEDAAERFDKAIDHLYDVLDRLSGADVRTP